MAKMTNILGVTPVWHGKYPLQTVKLWPDPIQVDISFETKIDLTPEEKAILDCKKCDVLRGNFCDSHRPMRNVTPKPKLLK